MIDIWGVACVPSEQQLQEACLERDKYQRPLLHHECRSCYAVSVQAFRLHRRPYRLSDAEIETEILFYCLKRGKILFWALNTSPYKMLGKP